MRTGLVVIGVAFLTVAAVSAASLFLWPDTGSSRNVTTEVPITSSGPGETREALLAGTNTSSGSFTVSWQSTGAFEVVLYDVPNCGVAALTCIDAPAICHWSENLSGQWGARGVLSFPYMLVWTAQSGSVAALQATADSIAEVSPSAPVWATLATIGALASLGAVGIIAFFLGVFLRGGVYRRSSQGSSASASRTPQGEGGKVGATDPRTGSPADGGEGSRPGPPAPGP